MKIAFGSDHAGFELKNELIEHVKQLGYEVQDYGTYTNESCDYPHFARLVCKAINDGEAERGILVCGTGVGISMAANKVKGIRAVVCSEPFSAKLSRQHNDSNVLALGARVVGVGLANMIADEWLSAEFEGERHQRRVDMIEG